MARSKSLLNFRESFPSGSYAAVSWPNMPVERTAHSARFFIYSRGFLMWAAAHR